MRTLAILTAAFALVGCFPATTVALREEAATRDTFVVEQSYHEVYRAVTDRLRGCHEWVGIGGGQRVRSELFTDIRRGEAVVEILGGLGRAIVMMVEIEGLEDGKTAVRAYQSMGSAFVPAVRKWIEEDYRECAWRVPMPVN